MSTPDPWDVLSSRYRHDSDAQFVFFVEQLGEARELLVSDAIPKQRMALVAIDNLAEVVLHRHRRRIESFAEEGWRHCLPRLSRKDLRELNSDFGARVRLGRRGGEDALIETMLQPVLDKVDDAVFRTGHAYRNRVYHADHHNEAVLQLIAAGYAGAVGRAFVRLQPTNMARSMTPRLERLAEYGYTGSEGWGISPAFAPAAAAEEIVRRLVGDLEPPISDAKIALCDDISWRADWADEMIAHLIGQPGMTEDRFLSSFRWGEFWTEHGRDEEIVAYDRKLSEVWREIVSRAEDEDRPAFDQIAELQEARNARVVALLKGFTPAFDIGVIHRTRRLGKRLSTARDLGALSIRYQKLDETMETIETMLDEMAIGWDRHVQEEEDQAREK